MGSARSEKNFFDKQSEICQKISSSKKYTDMRMKVDLPKYLIFEDKFHIFVGIIYTF